MVRIWLIDIRKNKKLTQADVANQAGISRTTYNRYESGQRTPKPAIARKLSRILAVPIVNFFDQKSDI